MIELRDYQKESIDKTIEYLNDNRGNPVIIGPTGVACKNLNRSFIGIELDKKYFDIASDRINGTLI